MHRVLRAFRSCPAVFAALACCGGANASLGPFEHGAGIKAMGAGGVSYVGAGETTVLSANPALAIDLGRRVDVGYDLLMLHPNSTIEGNAAAGDQRFASDGRRVYGIPQVGVSLPLGERWALGVTMLQAGLGPDYPERPYARFGGAERASLTLGSGSVASVLAWPPVERDRFGAGLVLGYQFLTVKGLQFLTATEAPNRVSVAPDKLTNQGKEGGFSVGDVLGCAGELTPRLSAGAGYRSKSWTERLDDYRGVLPDEGKLELPAVYGAALAYRLRDDWSVAFEWQRCAYQTEKAFGNPIARLSEGQLLGSTDGPASATTTRTPTSSA